MARILMAIHRLWNGGGTETHLLTLAAGMVKRGHVVGIFTTGGPWTGRAERMGIRIHKAHDISWFASERDVQLLTRVIQEHGYTVIHAHDTPTYRMSRIAAYRTGARFYFTVHGPYVSREAILRNAKHANRVFTVSDGLSSYVTNMGIVPSHIVKITNGVDTAVYRPSSTKRKASRALYKIPRDAFVIGYAGRFNLDKLPLGLTVTGILRRYARRHQGVYVLIAGRNSKQETSSSTRLQVLGHVPKMSEFYNACDLVIGTGRVAIESLACEVPTIAIGHNSYYGLVTPDNLHTARQTNFGDHMRQAVQVTERGLLRDIRNTRMSITQKRRDAKVIRRRLEHLISANRMVRQVLGIYFET